MEKIIEIDLINEDDLFERYNRKNVSKDLINYIIDSVTHFNKKDEIKLVIKNNLNNIDNLSSIIRTGLQKEYDNVIINHRRNNVIQLIYLLLGILAIFASTIIETVIFKEISLIGGWVFIWSMVESQLFSDTKDKRKTIILKKLLNSKIIEMK